MSTWRPVVRLVAIVALTLLGTSAANAQEVGSAAAVPAQVPSVTATGPATLIAALAAIENLPKYEPSNWGYSVMDQETGDVIAAQNADHLSTLARP
jgi:D-alanyl-D-alanine carboxypeptidase